LRKDPTINSSLLLPVALSLAAASAPASASAQHDHAAAAPYAGMQHREIKALADEDRQRLMQGHGMSLALAAELNGYPGPSHVLEHAQALQLTEAQRSATQALMARHKARAQALGQRIVEAERALDASFAARTITSGSLQQHTRAIGELQASLRAEHLGTHLEQTALLTPEQVAHYQKLRGYGTAHHHHGGHR